MLKVALVGIGRVAQYQIEALSQVPGVELTDAHDIDIRKAESLPSSVKFHSSLKALLKNSLADIFIVSTPTPTHFQVTVEILAANRSVLVEKPLCTTPAELASLLELVSTSGSFVSTAFHAAFAQDVLWWIDHRARYADQLGPLLGFNSGFFDPYMLHGALSSDATSLCSAWMDSGINALSVICQFIPASDLELTESRMTVLADRTPLQPQGLAMFRFRNGTSIGHGVIDTNWTSGVDLKTTRLRYANADIVLHHSLESVLMSDAAGSTMIADLRSHNSRLTSHYISLISSVSRDYAEGRSNIQSAALIHDLLFSAMREHRPM
jgi:D-galactose 1-dehydrogenase